MLLGVKRANRFMYSAILLCFVVLLLFYFISKLQFMIRIGELQTKQNSNTVLSRQNKEKRQFGREKHNTTFVTMFNQTKWNNVKLREDASKLRSPFINPVFHIDISRVEEKNYIILFWESPDWFKNWSFSADIKQCLNYTNCKQTFDRSYFNLSQVVVFNLPHSGIDQNPPVAADIRNPNQVWVFFTLESPLHINPIYKRPEWHSVFNWSWTYHPNADIFHPYGVLVKKQPLSYRNYSNIFKRKTKFAAWVVSNCHAPSKRNDYVNILKRYIEVDVYGRCGQQAPENLESFLSENYKFYLGFENSICDNYMTEKVFHYYGLDVITVLRGSTKYHDYLPSGSYIDTANFTTVEALAQFMIDLSKDEEKYVNYLKVKDEFTVYERELLYKDALCNLCEKLNNPDKNRHAYGDIFKWLGQCYEARDLK